MSYTEDNEPDRIRDREFYEQPDRFFTRRDLTELRDELMDTSDDIRTGLSVIGIDPNQFDDEDIKHIVAQLAEMGLEFSEGLGEWVET